MIYKQIYLKSSSRSTGMNCRWQEWKLVAELEIKFWCTDLTEGLHIPGYSKCLRGAHRLMGRDQTGRT